MTTIFPIEVTCENCGDAIFAIEIGSTNNFTGDPYSEFTTIDKCPECDHRLDHPVVVWRDDVETADHEASP